ncbi:hypothetical protein AA0473_2111 [Acetobacter orleanensis NRIC 0473]|nr:hypothetical protein AA0473_2111 [Acetobacter orleanensis NRIC 0473]
MFIGSLAFGPVASRTTTTLSDTGFVDTAAHCPYPPYLAACPDMDRELDITVSGTGLTQTFGQLTVNLEPGVADSCNVLNHTADIAFRTGLRTYDAARGWWIDPALSDCLPLFTGSASAWRTGATQGTLTLSAPAALTRSLPLKIYAGTGGVEGTSTLSGKVKPRLRGFATGMTPVCVDTVNQIYQISDAPVQIGNVSGTPMPNLTVFEGGVPGAWSSTSTAGSWSYGGMVQDITSADPAAGHYVVEASSRGTFVRLGGTPVYPITISATGLFPDGTHVSRLHDVLRQVLVQDVGIPASTIAANWADPFDAVAGHAVPSDAGAYWDGSSSYTGADMVTTLLQGTLRKLTYDRDGTLRLIGITPAFLSLVPNLWVTLAVRPDEVIDIRQADLPSELALPFTCGRCTYARNYTVLTGSNVSPKAAVPSIGTARSAVTVGTDAPTLEVVSPPDVLTAFQNSDAAQVVANVINQLWTQPNRRLFHVTLPFARLADFKIGSNMILYANVDGLRTGAGGLVVGESYRGSSAGEVTFTVLV